MNAIEKRARELLSAAYKATEYPPMVHESHGLMHGRLDRREQAALLAIIAAITPPEGVVLVPVEPTEAMVEAAQEAHMPFGDMGFAISAAIAARPEVPNGQ